MTLTFVVTPEGAGQIFCDGTDVTGQTLEVEPGRTVQIHLDPAEGHELQNWNEGQWFDPDWVYEVEGSAVITAVLS